MPAVSGTVKDANGNFARRLVRVHRRDTGALVGETLSNPSTGVWSMTTADTSKHYAVAHDSDAWITYLPFNGDNGSTSFSEWGGKSVTAYGNAQISTAQSKFGGAAAYFDGGGDYLSLASSSDFGFGSGDFTLEGWVRPSAHNYVIADFRNSTSNAPGVFYIDASGYLGHYDGSARLGNIVVALNAWSHFAFSRQSGTLRCFVNGSKCYEGSVSSGVSSAMLTIGSQWNLAVYLNGYLDDFRISKGVARYIANFTPPAAPHSDALATMKNAMVYDFLTPV